MLIVNGFLRFVLVAFLVSCSSTPPAKQSSRPNVSAQEKRDKIVLVQTLRPQIRSRLERREFLAALRLLQREVNSGVSESRLAKEYGLALRGGILFSAELSRKGKFSKCGIYSRQLLNLYPHNLPVIPGVSAVQINQGMNFCSDQLMLQGLAAYRAGQMQQAINFWTELLGFNPERTEAQKAIDTCSLQLQNLKSKP